MPVREEGGLDLPALGRLFFELSDQADLTVLEKPNPMPSGGNRMGNRTQGAMSMFSFGKTCGAIEAMLVAFRMPYVLVHPSTWMAALHKGQDKKLPSWHKALTCVERMFPLEDFRASLRCQKPHDGLVDAALIATFGRLAVACDPSIPTKWHNFGGTHV